MTELMINRPVRGLLAVLVTGGCGAFPPMTRAQEAVAAPPSALCLAASYTGDFRRNTTGGMRAPTSRPRP